MFSPLPGEAKKQAQKIQSISTTFARKNVKNWVYQLASFKADLASVAKDTTSTSDQPWTHDLTSIALQVIQKSDGQSFYTDLKSYIILNCATR